MTAFSWVFDSLLAASLLWLAWSLLFTRDLFRGVIYFVVFGLLMALTWARLRAIDVALAEAIVGSGVTGALLFSTVGWVRSTRNQPPNELEGPDEL